MPIASIQSTRPGKFGTKCSSFGSNPLFQSLFSHVLGSNHSYQVWEKIHEHFNLHTKSRACQLRTAMRAVSLQGRSMDEYLHKIKGYVDELVVLVFWFTMRSTLMQFWKVSLLIMRQLYQ